MKIVIIYSPLSQTTTKVFLLFHYLHCSIQKQFGLDNSGGYRKQMERTMERAVSRGQMVPAEFHRKKAEMLESLASGMDDGRSKTSGLIESAS